MKKHCLCVLSLIALPALADNQQGFYAGLGFSSVDLSRKGIDEIDRTRNAEILAGYKYNDALGIEVRFGDGKTTGAGTSWLYPQTDSKGVVAHDPKWTPTFGDVERSLGAYQSIYYKAELVNDEAKLYALLGYTTVDSTVSVWPSKSLHNTKPIQTSSESLSGVSYGIGVGFILTEHFNINVEYKNLCDEISEKPNALSVNVDYRF